MRTEDQVKDLQRTIHIAYLWPTQWHVEVLRAALRLGYTDEDAHDLARSLNYLEINEVEDVLNFLDIRE